VLFGSGDCIALLGVRFAWDGVTVYRWDRALEFLGHALLGVGVCFEFIDTLGWHRLHTLHILYFRH
jgi:hypothetical protein